MTKKGEITNLKAWLLVLVSLLDDAALLALLFLALWFFHVKITWVIILVIVLVVAILFIIMHKAVVPSLRRRKVTGAEGMIGQTAQVTQPLQPRGIIKINNEYWKAISIDGDVEEGGEVEIVGITRLVLEVKRTK